MFFHAIGGFCLLALIFIPLERWLGLRRQPILRFGWWTDVIYYFTGYCIGRGAGMLITLAVSVLMLQQKSIVAVPIATQPIWLQLFEAMLVADIGYYFAHRLLHCVPWLWRFHQVHHSAKELDWLAAVKVHPLDQVFTKVFQLVPLLLLGFSQETFAAYVLISAAIAFFIHANLKVDCGVLKWIIMTPEAHHCHHSSDPGRYNKNFAAQLPLVDWLGGTLYLPRHYRPDRYGIAEPVPSSYLQQLIHPFRRKMTYVP
ncbi:fatty acid hydroxylase [Leptolyngbya sp. 'hensonii']|uniref:sterol desaturase family protein n=1 Tax=Leptolyngbya sp. 'hensonii' TaxID=1922337 RepID=UPI00094F7D93|nr:sterol desaturase family protein [Leptolyngbya sp. 'hensonii']OLP16190.1 fatty acid hydroxylase [Leptolyngbya sp. 'hensonii']